MKWNCSVCVLYRIASVPPSHTRDLYRYRSCQFLQDTHHICVSAIIFMLHPTNASAAGWSLSALYLHSAHRHETRMTRWVCSCFRSHVYKKHHNFGVLVLTLSHILDITVDSDAKNTFFLLSVYFLFLFFIFFYFVIC